MKIEEIKEIIKIVSENMGISGGVNLLGVKKDLESLNVEKEQPNHKTQAFEVDKVEAKEVLPMPKESLEVEGLLKMILNSYKAIMTLEDYRMVYNSIVQQAEILNNKLIDKTQHKAKEHTKPNSNHTGKINN